MSSSACNTCGGTEMNLVNGFYYCIECGTQDSNLQETIVERAAVNVEIIATTHKIAVDHGADKMSVEWHKWHTYNFILSGMADELVSLGAKTSFKTKLLWIWTRYIAKFHDPSAMNTSVQDDPDLEDNLNESENENDVTQILDAESDQKFYTKGIKIMTLALLQAMLYVALNLDNSDIQLSNLHFFIQETRVTSLNFLKFLPKGLKVTSIPKWCKFHRSVTWKIGQFHLRSLSFQLFKRLDLGEQIVPDFGKLIERYLTELCLPEEIKTVVFSLVHTMQYKTPVKSTTTQVLDYESLAMAYILMTMKMLFGLDDEYETKLSNTAEQINDNENHIRLYKGIHSESGERLFSFREWCYYMEFRKRVLAKYNYHVAVRNNLETDVETFFQQTRNQHKNVSLKKTLADELLLEILNKIKDGREKVDQLDFKASLTPLTTYTELLISHLNDPDMKLTLSEDFSLYSIKYITDDLTLTDKNKDMIVGINKRSKTIERRIRGTFSTYYGRGEEMVYVKHCDNKNWFLTKPPKSKHITKTQENDYNQNDTDLVDSTVVDTEEEVKDIKCEILEEDTEYNIFDDAFEDVKQEKVENDDDLVAENQHFDTFQYDGNNLSDMDQNLGDTTKEEENTDVDTIILKPQFNPSTFDRNETIKRLIEHECELYKIPLPRDVKPREIIKRKSNTKDANIKPKRPKNEIVDAKKEINGIITSYFATFDNDFTETLFTSLQNAINDSYNTNLLNNTVDKNLSTSHLDNNHDDIDTNLKSFNANVKGDSDNENNIDNKSTDSLIILNDGSIVGDQPSLPSPPRYNPEFDENVYDVNQLYVKCKDATKHTVHFEIDPKIEEILSKDVEKNRKAKRKQHPPDDINNKSMDNKDFPLLMNPEIVKKKYKYWKRAYETSYLAQNNNIPIRFEEELDEYYPKSFNYVIRLCADILGTSSAEIYYQLEKLEVVLTSRPFHKRIMKYTIERNKTNVKHK